METQPGYKELGRHGLAISADDETLAGQENPFSYGTVGLSYSTAAPCILAHLPMQSGFSPVGLRWFCCSSHLSDTKMGGCLHLQCLRIKAGLTDLTPAVKGSQAFLSSSRHRSRCVSAIMHVHIINLCIPVNLDMCWPCWINCVCVAQQQLRYVLVLEQPCMHNLVTRHINRIWRWPFYLLFQ